MTRVSSGLALGRLLAVLSIAGCSSQARFAGEFVETYCDAYATCDTSGRPCPVAEGEGAYDACDFDADAAETCLDGPYTCDDTVFRFETLDVPAACLNVCGTLPGPAVPAESEAL